MAQEDPPLTPEQAWSVRRHIRRIEDLEILLLLGQEPARSWTADEVAARLRASLSIVQDGLERLSAGFLAVERAPEPAFRFAPVAELGALVSALQRIYAENPAALIRFIAAQPPAALRDFADAFRIKKEER